MTELGIYKPPKNLLKLSTSELPPVLLLLIRLGEEGEEEEEVVDMRAARSSYLAWDSRGSWPKRLNANGAAVDVGNRENEEEEEEEEDTEAISEGENGIYGILSAAVWGWRGWV